MPPGDPAGYLPNVIKKRLKSSGVKPYKSRRNRGGVKPSSPPAGPTGGVEAPNVTPLPRRLGGKVPKPSRRRPFKSTKSGV